MDADATDHLAWLTRKLDRLGSLGSEDHERLASLPRRVQKVSRFHRLIREGDHPEHCCLLIEGYASRNKHSAAGARQVVSFHLRGDLLDIQHLLLSQADHDVETITPAVVAWIPRADLLRLAWERPAIGQALWRDCLIDASVFREWVLNVGQRDAKTRIAHMLCEFVARCAAAGLGQPEGFKLPLTQAQIGDATGLTAVHVNRMLQGMRTEGALEKGSGQVRIGDWALLQAIARFDASYLHAAA